MLSWAADLSQALAAADDNVTPTIPSTESVAASTTWRPTTSNSAVLFESLSPSWPAGTSAGNTNTNVILNQMAFERFRGHVQPQVSSVLSLGRLLSGQLLMMITHQPKTKHQSPFDGII